MELTKNQEKILAHALKVEEVRKKQADVAVAAHRNSIEKIKEACQGSGTDEQIKAKAYQLLAQAYLRLPDDPSLEV